MTRYFLIDFESSEITPLSDTFMEQQSLWQYIDDIQTILDSQTNQILTMDFDHFQPIPSSLRWEKIPTSQPTQCHYDDEL